ncbi:hypothetical protein [Streptosporangium roseum]|uniref:hypothetical protein n=1 Tax=Streptosporangium roseum TaxID=2001 RepID=UPI00343E0CEC
MSDQILAHLDGIGPGWHPLLLRLHEELLAVSPSYSVQQVKEKYGTLCIYLLTGLLRHLHQGGDGWPEPHEAERYKQEDDAATLLVRAAEQESARICESCGNPGQARQGPWIKILCDDCNACR